MSGNDIYDEKGWLTVILRVDPNSGEYHAVGGDQGPGGEYVGLDKMHLKDKVDRIKYQGIAYSCCQMVDAFFGGKSRVVVDDLPDRLRTIILSRNKK